MSQIEKSEKDEEMDRSKRGQPLTILAPQISCPVREDPKKTESSGTGSIAPKQFYPVREERKVAVRPPTFYPSKLSVKSEEKKKTSKPKSAIRKPEKSQKKSKTLKPK